MCRTYVYSVTVYPYSRLLGRTYSHTLVRVNINQNSSGGGYVHLSGQSGTRLTAYHIYGMWLVLIKLINTDGVPFQAMILHITSSVILIVVAEK
jgi:hypothetical protein